MSLLSDGGICLFHLSWTGLAKGGAESLSTTGSQSSSCLVNYPSVIFALYPVTTTKAHCRVLDLLKSRD